MLLYTRYLYIRQIFLIQMEYCLQSMQGGPRHLYLPVPFIPYSLVYTSTQAIRSLNYANMQKNCFYFALFNINPPPLLIFLKLLIIQSFSSHPPYSLPLAFLVSRKGEISKLKCCDSYLEYTYIYVHFFNLVNTPSKFVNYYLYFFFNQETTAQKMRRNLMRFE